jgi:hypothetical protein
MNLVHLNEDYFLIKRGPLSLVKLRSNLHLNARSSSKIPESSIPTSIIKDHSVNAV